MYYLEKVFSFEAGHRLTNHEGQCFNPHGHSYTLKVVLRAEKLHDSGSQKNMVMDFGDIARPVKALIDEYLDHCWLNDTLECSAPTAEFIAYWVYQKLQHTLPYLHSVTVAETATASATYTEGD
ncbi:MAG: 6-carboxytetrahydropterin synthase QueD [Chlamydiota bacterium]